MSFEPKVYTLGHVLYVTGLAASGSVLCYVNGQGVDDAGMNWFAETWMPYIGVGATVLTFLVGLGFLGKPWYDDETNKQLKAEYDRAMFEWRCKSPEERAILMAAEENRLLQLTQIMQNNLIIQN